MEEEQIPQLEKSQFDKTKFFIPASIIIAALIVSGTIFYTRGEISNGTANIGNTAPGTNQGGTVKVSVDDDPFLGPKNAKVVLVEFSDFQCPFCRKFWRETFLQIKKEFIDTGKIKFVYRDFPLDFHPQAKNSAEAAECADDQDKFWEFHDHLFLNQTKLADADLKKYAQALTLDASKFNECYDSKKYQALVDQSKQEAESLGISATPTFLINGTILQGAQPFEKFKERIDPLVKSSS